MPRVAPAGKAKRTYSTDSAHIRKIDVTLMFESLSCRGFQIAFLSHASAILSVDFPDAVAELETALGQLSIPIEEIIGSGGGEAKGTQRLRRSLVSRGWKKTKFAIEKRINGVPKGFTSHEIDHVRQFQMAASSH